jgi:integrase
MREGIADANPVIGTNKPPEPPSRDRVLTDAELAEIWAASQDEDYGRIVKLALLTGARREEIGGLKWQEVDVNRAMLELPSARTKNRRPHAIPLSPLALSIVKEVPQREKRSFIWRGRWGVLRLVESQEGSGPSHSRGTPGRCEEGPHIGRRSEGDASLAPA